MVWNDTNASLGGALPLAFVLAVMVLVAGGSLAIWIWGRVWSVPAFPFWILAFYYLAVGSAAYALAGPFALGADAQTYDAQAAGVAAQFGNDQFRRGGQDLDYGKWGFPWLLGIVYIFGRIPVAGILLNSTLVALTAISVARIAHDAFGTVSFQRIVLTFMLFPGFVMLGSGISREPSSWYGVSVMGIAYVQFVCKKRVITALVLATVSFVWLMWIRLPLAPLILMSFMAGELARRLWIRLSVWGILLGFAVVLLGLVSVGNSLLTLVGLNGDAVMQTREYLASIATTGFVVDPGLLSNLGWTGYLIATLPHVLLGPFPWTVASDLVWIWVSINAVAWWMALITAITAIRALPRQDVAWGLLTTALVVIVGLGATLTNYGIAIRLRSIPMVLVAAIIGAGPMWVTFNKQQARL